MSNDEKQILHGLYCQFGTGKAIAIKPHEIFWLAQTPIPGGKLWRKENGDFKSKLLKVGDYLTNDAATTSAVEKSLNYLQQTGFISFHGKGAHFEISVTALGADLARELDSRLGRWNLWYKKHKDGLPGLLITVAVSVLVSILTTASIWAIWKK